MKKQNPSTTESWKKLKDHHKQMKETHLIDLFNQDHSRFNRFSLRIGEIFLDYSKNLITDETLRLLLAFSEEMGLKSAIQEMSKMAEIDGRKVEDAEKTMSLY